MKIDLSLNTSNYKRFFREGIFIDNGPLMLLLYGAYDKRNKTNFLSCIDYQAIHFEALVAFISGLPARQLRLIITPHVFTEFYKHAQKDFSKDMFNAFFKECTDKLLQIDERPVSKNLIITHDLFVRFDIGELSLMCLRAPLHYSGFHAIIHHDKGIDRGLDKDKNICTIHDTEDVYSWFLSSLQT